MTKSPGFRPRLRAGRAFTLDLIAFSLPSRDLYISATPTAMARVPHPCATEMGNRRGRFQSPARQRRAASRRVHHAFTGFPKRQVHTRSRSQPKLRHSRICDEYPILPIDAILDMFYLWAHARRVACPRITFEAPTSNGAFRMGNRREKCTEMGVSLGPAAQALIAAPTPRFSQPTP